MYEEELKNLEQFIEKKKEQRARCKSQYMYADLSREIKILEDMRLDLIFQINHS